MFQAAFGPVNELVLSGGSMAIAAAGKSANWQITLLGSHLLTPSPGNHTSLLHPHLLHPSSAPTLPLCLCSPPDLRRHGLFPHRFRRVPSPLALQPAALPGAAAEACSWTCLEHMICCMGVLNCGHAGGAPAPSSWPQCVTPRPPCLLPHAGHDAAAAGKSAWLVILFCMASAARVLGPRLDPLAASHAACRLRAIQAATPRCSVAQLVLGASCPSADHQPHQWQGGQRPRAALHGRKLGCLPLLFCVFWGHVLPVSERAAWM